MYWVMSGLIAGQGRARQRALCYPQGTIRAGAETAVAPGTKRQQDLRKTLRAMAPRIPMLDAGAVLEAAQAGHLRHLPVSIAVWQGLASHVRHTHTDYDLLLDDGYDRDAARFFVAPAMNEVFEDWGCARRIGEDDGEDQSIGLTGD